MRLILVLLAFCNFVTAEEVSKVLARNIYRYRTMQNLNRTELARKSNLPLSSIKYLESGSGNPGLNNVAKIAKALGTGVDDLLAPQEGKCKFVLAASVPSSSSAKGRMRVFKLFTTPGTLVERIEFSGAVMTKGPSTPSDKREYLSIISGRLVVEVDKEYFDLRKGDVLELKGGYILTFLNPTNAKSIAIRVVTEN